MKPLPALEVDLVIEHGGRRLHLQGSGRRFTATFPSLASLFHFLRIAWATRKHIPRQASLQIEWRRLRIPVKSARQNRLP